MKLLKYFFVGGISALIDISLFTLLVGYLEFPWVPVSICTFVIATFVNYFISIRFVFESGSRYQKHYEILGVFIISALALFVNQLVLYICIEWLQFHLVISKVASTGVVFFWNYFARNKIIFAEPYSDCSQNEGS